MAYMAVTAFMKRDHIPPSGIIVTAVLSGGCNLDCPYCIVKKRDERRMTSYVTEAHLTALLDGLQKRGLLGGAAIVGDEPLQEHCWPTARAFLHHAGKLPTAVITNGYNLIDYTGDLADLPTTNILLSLDGVGDVHDNLRRKPGAFARISRGIAALGDETRKRLSIASVLMPSNADAIADIIAFTAAQRIPQLLLSPLLISTRNEPLSVHPKIMREGWQGVPRLLDQAEAAGVKLRLSDEFAVLGEWGDRLASTGVEIVAPKQPARLIRIDAAGRVETLATMQAGITTGLELPREISEIDAFADRLAGPCFEQARSAA